MSVSGGGRKFNIWIAYSDLFTNLSTFLFISAVGIFAIMGSGSLTAPDRPGARQCSFVGSLESKIGGGDSLLQRYPVAPKLPGRSRECAEYFSIRDFRFHTASADPRAFQNDQHQAASLQNLQDLCVPLWRILADRKFEKRSGRISFIGISDPEGGPSTAQCGSPRTMGKPGFPARVSAEETIRRCKANSAAYQSKSVSCAEILGCLAKEPDDRNDWCQGVVAIELHEKMARVECFRAPAAAQAQTLHDLCEAAQWERGFPTQLFRRHDTIDLAGGLDGRAELWRRNVSYEGVASTGPLEPGAANPTLAKAAAAAPRGGLLIEFRYGY